MNRATLIGGADRSIDFAGNSPGYLPMTFATISVMSTMYRISATKPNCVTELMPLRLKLSRERNSTVFLALLDKRKKVQEPRVLITRFHYQALNEENKFACNCRQPSASRKSVS